MHSRLVIETQFVEITIDRPKQLNALNSEVLLELQTHLDEIEALLQSAAVEVKPRLLVIRGAGEKAFVAGADINELAAFDATQISTMISEGQSLMNRIASLPIPVVAVVDGFALGGGCELALAADLIVSNSKAVFGLPEVLLGLIPGFGGTQRLTRRVGSGTAKRLVFTGAKIDAEEAYRIGLSDFLFEEQTFDEQLAKLIGELLKRAPLAIAAAKVCIDHAAQSRELDGFSLEAQSFHHVRASADAQLGLEGFLQQTSVKFKGN